MVDRLDSGEIEKGRHSSKDLHDARPRLWSRNTYSPKDARLVRQHAIFYTGGRPKIDLKSRLIGEFRKVVCNCQSGFGDVVNDLSQNYFLSHPHSSRRTRAARSR